MSTQIQQGTGNKLKDPLLMKHIIDELHKNIAGQDKAIIILTLKIMLRLVKNAKATSSNILISDKTGAGKDYLTKHVCKVLLKSNKTCYHRTKLSPQVFNYWQPFKMVNKKKVTISWDGKVIYLEDPETNVTKSQGFKVMASGGTSMTVVKDQNVLDKKIDGKPVIIITSMKADIDDEGQRRFSVMRLENGESFIDACFDLEADKEEGKIPAADMPFQHALQNLLESYNVKIPHMRKIFNSLPKTRLMNTQKHKLLDYIRASAILHQQQRDKEDGDTIKANMFDFYLGLYAFCLSGDYENRSLNIQQEEIFEILEDAYSKKEVTQDKNTKIDVVNHGLKTREIGNLVGLSFNGVKPKLEDMQTKGLIIGFEQFDASRNTPSQYWKINPNAGSIIFMDLVNKIKRSGIKPGKDYKKLFTEINKSRKKAGLSPLEEV